MKCPNCGSAFQSVTMPSHYDIPIVVEQCVSCGGIWFDKDELFRVKSGEAQKLEALDEKKLATPSAERAILHCPKHKTRLRSFSDPNFPKEIHVEKCGVCDGFWFNRGEFSEYQNLRKPKEPVQKTPEQIADEELGKKIEAFLSLDSNSATYKKLGMWGKTLSSPASVGEGGGISLRGGSNDLLGAMWLFLRIVLRFIR